MPFFGPRLILTSLLAAIGAILLFIASAAGLAIEPRVLIAIPNLPHASLRLHALRPATGFDSGLPTSAGADVNVSVASITSTASTNISLPLPTDRASRTSALSWPVVELADLGPTTNSGSWHRTGADADASFTIASIIAHVSLGLVRNIQATTSATALRTVVRRHSFGRLKTRRALLRAHLCSRRIVRRRPTRRFPLHDQLLAHSSPLHAAS